MAVQAKEISVISEDSVYRLAFLLIFSLLLSCGSPLEPTMDSYIIEYDIPKTDWYSLIIYSSTGRKIKDLIANEIHIIGKYSVDWYLDNNYSQIVNKGLYYYELSSADKVIKKEYIIVE